MLPSVTNADIVHSLKRSMDLRYIAPVVRMTSSTASRLAFAIIITTCRSSFPAFDPGGPGGFTLVAPERAATVPEKAEVDQAGSWDASVEVGPETGREEMYDREYNGVSNGLMTNK